MLKTKMDHIVQWIRSTTDVASGRGALVPVSGGSDSALCFWLCIQALSTSRVRGIYFGRDLRCRDWFEAQGKVETIPELGEQSDPELSRWTRALRKAREFRGWLVGSRNRTEETLGTYSLASRLSTYLPLASLWKSEVMELAEFVGVPQSILQSSTMADPACGRPAAMAAIPFHLVDVFLRVKVGELSEQELGQLSAGQIDYLASLYARNSFKAALPLRPAALAR
jgi:NH3-dependent NAD+ synthetase